MQADSAVRIVANDNRSPGGTLRHGVLTLRLDVCRGRWFPEADTGPSELVLAFAEAGHRPQIPGPLIRVPSGTLIRAFVRNPLRDSTLVLHGFHTRPGLAVDTIQVGPGATREVRFTAGEPGTFFYWGSTADKPLEERKGGDSQLYGALVVDPPGASPIAPDRVFAIGVWAAPRDTLGPKPWVPRDMMVINGRSWPYTERLTFTVGDTVRWRWINATADAHTMHLHGFY